MIKRGIDILFSLIGLICLFPFFIFISFFIFITSKGGVFFVQLRVGKNNKDFKLYKFRTMFLNSDNKGLLTVGNNDKRITKLGYYLRKNKLDELPQLLNVLFGSMSLVGPRPLLMQYLTLYNKEQARRHEVKPGITGWAQVNGRNAISWEEKFRLDVTYVDKQCFFLDLKIPLRLNARFQGKHTSHLFFFRLD